LRLTRLGAVLQIHDPATPLKLSEVLPEVVLQPGDLPAYRGRAVVTSLVDAGTHLLCQLQLDAGALSPAYLASLDPGADPAAGFDLFVEALYRHLEIEPGFKVAVADLHSALMDLQAWTERLELGAAAAALGNREGWLNGTVDALGPKVIPLLNRLFSRYEQAVQALGDEEISAHRAYVQRLLHPIVLAAPFAHRTFHKPLGYAGDFEMVNMMLRDPREGATLFARLFNVWLLSQDAAAAHRQRIGWLAEQLLDVAASAARSGRRARVYNLGCGPCQEIHQLIDRGLLVDHLELTLADFDPQALDHARESLFSHARRRGQRLHARFVRKSIRELIRESAPEGGILGGTGAFDLVYCAGLFDYLSDAICRRFLGLGVRSLLPEGRLLCTNVSTDSPNRGSLDLILDWHLAYRDAAALRRLVPTDLGPLDLRLETEFTGANVFLEISPRHAD
jgi:extracellular factor (EF) 3-hydroxypalmitic acid methyl ester biosynthesis protein